MAKEITSAGLASYADAPKNAKSDRNFNYLVDRADQRDSMDEVPRTEREAKLDFLKQKYDALAALLQEDFKQSPITRESGDTPAPAGESYLEAVQRQKNTDGTRGFSNFELHKGQHLSNTKLHLQELLQVVRDIEKFK